MLPGDPKSHKGGTPAQRWTPRKRCGREMGAPPGPRQALTSSSRRRCSFCSSMRFWRSASSCRLCSSFSRCCCSSCCRRRASERSLLASWSLRKSRRSVDSPGRFRMELRDGDREMGILRVAGAIVTQVLGAAGLASGSPVGQHRLSEPLLLTVLSPRETESRRQQSNVQLPFQCDPGHTHAVTICRGTSPS